KKVKEQEDSAKQRELLLDQDIREIEEENDVDLAHDDLPDPESEMISCLLRNMQRLEDKINKLEKELEEKNVKSL
ncbi:MAG: serine O-acetyltransferase, partial [Selenomonadaceae bacterium]